MAEKKQILVVDDEESMREMLALMLAHEGYEVTVALGGEMAIKALKTKRFTIMLSDVRMPSMDGLTLLKKIKEEHINIPVIMMSAFVDHDTAIEALKLGAIDYISKPFKKDEVVLKIRLAEERVKLAEKTAILEAENKQLKGPMSPPEIARARFIGANEKVQKLLNMVIKIAPYKSTVLIQGESGTGKEIVARLLHDLSPRAGAPFIAINCGAIPENLLESELFGHIKGAFTDAHRDKKGLIEEADGGTLFLDEVAELPLSLQVKLLRFLQEEEIRRIGDNKDIKLDVRVVAASAVNIAEAVHEGRFREDLFYRLNVLQVAIPPLRERREDIPLLAAHFVALSNRRHEKNISGFTPEAMELMVNYSWPGNVRELENSVERAVVLSDTPLIEADILPEKYDPKEEESAPLLSSDPEVFSIKEATARLERELIIKALKKTDGNRTKAAKLLDLSHRALLYKLHDYNIK